MNIDPSWRQGRRARWLALADSFLQSGETHKQRNKQTTQVD